MFVTKEELLKSVFKKTAFPKKEIKIIFESITGEIKKGLIEKQGVKILNFGIFEKAHQNARTFRNPQTGLPLAVKVKNNVKFKPSKELEKIIQ